MHKGSKCRPKHPCKQRPWQVTGLLVAEKSAAQHTHKPRHETCNHALSPCTPEVEATSYPTSLQPVKIARSSVT